MSKSIGQHTHWVFLNNYLVSCGPDKEPHVNSRILVEIVADTLTPEARRLIEALPDLLEALKELESNARNASVFIPHVLLVSAVEQAQAAIIKATGEKKK